MLQKTLRILTYNILAYENYEARRPVLRAGIEALKPDVISFQEAGYATDKPHQVADLLDGLGYHIDHQLDGVARPTNEGNCIASRWPIERVAVEPLPSTARCGTYPVAILGVKVHAPLPIGDFLMVNPKPYWQFYAEAEREQQALAVARFVDRHADRKGFPPVVASDFDAAPDRASIRFMTGRQSLEGYSTHFLDAWEIAGAGGPGHTWSSDNPLVPPIADRMIRQRNHRRRIDYVFLGSPALYSGYARIDRCTVEFDTPLNGVYASDHYAVMADIATVP